MKTDWKKKPIKLCAWDKKKKKKRRNSNSQLLA